MAYVPEKKHIEFMTYELKGGAATWGISYKSHRGAKTNHP